MNYKAELRGFCVDRATKILEGGADPFSIDDVLKAAEQLVDYLYIPEKDIKALLETVIPLIIQSDDMEKLDNLILELQQIKAEAEAKQTRQ